jgi:hypothetical protein
MCCDVTASSFVTKVRQSHKSNTVACGIDCLTSQDELFVNSPLDVKENDEHALHFPLGRRQEDCFVGGDLTKLLD